MHIHKRIPKKDESRCWTHCVTPVECAANPMRQQSHGNILVTSICSCGATREAEVNANKINYGPWVIIVGVK